MSDVRYKEKLLKSPVGAKGAQFSLLCGVWRKRPAAVLRMEMQPVKLENFLVFMLFKEMS